MVTWKLALAVIIIAILLILTGMWFGYRYVRQQEDISPEARTFSLPVIAGHIRPSWDANVGIGLIPSPTSISWNGSRTSPVGAAANRAYRCGFWHLRPFYSKKGDLTDEKYDMHALATAYSGASPSVELHFDNGGAELLSRDYWQCVDINQHRWHRGTHLCA